LYHGIYAGIRKASVLRIAQSRTAMFTKIWEMQGLGKESTPAAVSDTNFYACNSAACSRTEGAALFDKKSKNAYVSLPLCVGCIGVRLITL
jgi:hypothetical protein